MEVETENIAGQEPDLAETLNNQPAQDLANGTILPQKETLPSQMNHEEHKKDEVANIPEKTTAEFEQLGGKQIYTVLAKTDRLCGPQMWKRVLREVKDVNDDFKTLRTTIGVVADMIGALHFLMYPSDGAMADKPLCGRILIPKTYPDIAPVVHLFTKTNRANLDNYHSYGEDRNLEQMHSSMCFDLVNPASHHASWKAEYTLSALISSLLQAIVSIKVAQIGGGEIAEFVSMEKLGAIHKSVESTYAHYQGIMPSRKEIVHLEGMKVDTKYFKFPEKITSLKNNQDLITQSDPIFLQVPDDKMKENVYSIGLDLSDLKTNISTVFSIILSTDPSDPVGKKNSTILVRNGVTATAAKKKAGKPIDWFYHGKPMNESDLKLIVTVGYNQFCISYYDGERKAVHGDRPVSCLTPAEIGSVGKQPFYLSLLLKNKGGSTVTVKTFIPEAGYVHPVAGGHS